MDYSKHFSIKKTNQNEPIPGEDQVANNGGGYSYKIDKWSMLDRFLILGSESGTYYVSEHKLTVDNAKNVIECIKEDGIKVIDKLVDVSVKGRASKNDSAIFVLSLCYVFGNAVSRHYALEKINDVCRIGTHLFQFISFVLDNAGWSRSLRRAISNWYNKKDVKDLAYQIIKYQNRNKWTHKDVLRLCHAKAISDEHNKLFSYIIGGYKENTGIPLIDSVEKLKVSGTDINTSCMLIKENRIPREAIPTKLLTNKKVLSVMLEDMPLTALIRNLGNLSKHGVLEEGRFDEIDLVYDKLTNKEYIHKSRVHPINILSAKMIYESGKGMKGGGTWEPVNKIIDALEEAFYLSFENVESTGKKILMGLDVSGSMRGNRVSGSSFLTADYASACLAMVTYKIEKNVVLKAFSSKFVDVNIGTKSSLKEIRDKMYDMEFGNTNCALPMIYALEKGLDIDAFIILTDSETNSGNIHPSQALREYRKKFNKNAKLVVVGMCATEVSIADPKDRGMLDIVGFDTETPNLISNFIGD